MINTEIERLKAQLREGNERFTATVDAVCGDIKRENERKTQALRIIHGWLTNMMASAYAPASSVDGYTIQTCIDLADEALGNTVELRREEHRE